MKLKNILQIYCVLFSFDFYYNRGWKRFEIPFFIDNSRDRGNRFAEISFRDGKVLISKQDVLQWLLSKQGKRNIKLKSVSLSKIQARRGCKEARLLWTKLCCFSYDFCFHPTGSQLEQKHLVLIKKSRVVHAAKNNFLIFSSSLLMREDLQGVKLISSPFEIHVV